MNNNSTQHGSKNLKNDFLSSINSTSVSKVILTDIYTILSPCNTGGFAVFINFLSLYLRFDVYKSKVQLNYCMLDNQHPIKSFFGTQKHQK
jgi:hypothetical protein